MITLILAGICIIGVLGLMWPSLLLPANIGVAFLLILERKHNKSFVKLALVALVFAWLAAIINTPF